MSRRPFRYTLILVSVALGTALAAFGGWRYARASAPLSGPILVISIDTLRADHLPVYGYRKVQTPALDRLASDSVVFERAYSHAAETLPAHVALMSGRLPFETGVRDNAGDPVKPGERLLPALLHERGYATAGVVSSDLLRKDTGFGQGFDFFDDAIPSGYPELSLGAAQRDGGASEQIAEQWLAKAGTSRAFLFLHLYEPHKPYAPPDRFAQYGSYDGEIAYADEIVGRLVRYLKSHQLYDRSTIIVLSDHGEGLGDHGEHEHGLFLYEEAVRVPLIIKQESNENAGRRVTDRVQQIDLVPTILDLVKAPVPNALRGRSLKPLLEGGGRLPRQAIYSETLYARNHFGWSELVALTNDRYRYIRAPREELYDLQRDPLERDNLLDPGRASSQTTTGTESPARVRSAMSAELDRLLGEKGVGSPFPTDATKKTPDPFFAEPLPDPKDMLPLLETFRNARDLAGEREWPQAIRLLQQVVRDDPAMTEAWHQLGVLAALMNRHDLAIEAYRREAALRPSEPAPLLALADVLLSQRKFEEARVEASAITEAAPEAGPGSRAAAHALLARIALARNDDDRARQEAMLARQADASLPLPAFIDGRVLYESAKYDEALPLLQKAIAEVNKAKRAPLPELHFYAGQTLARLDRQDDAEAEFLEELRAFPHEIRATTELATLYHAASRPDAAEEAILAMLRSTPNAEAYTAAVRLFKSFGKGKQAEKIRAEGRRLLAK